MQKQKCGMSEGGERTGRSTAGRVLLGWSGEPLSTGQLGQACDMSSSRARQWPMAQCCF